MFQNICVPNCKHTDQQTVNDEINKQCLYLGPFCGISATTNSSITGQEVPMCGYSYMQDHGYIVGSRFRILNYLQTETYLNPFSSLVSSLANLKQLAEKYIAPVEGNSFERVKQEINVNVVAKCQNKYCNMCEDFNTTKCVTCWGRFGDNNMYGRCH